MHRKGYAALFLSAIAFGLATPASALAVTPTVTTGGVSNVTFNSARLQARIDPNRRATIYYFQYGTTIALGSETAPADAGRGDRAVGKSVDVGGLAPVTKYYYRAVARNSSGTTLGKRRSFTTRRQPLGVSLAANPNPVKAASSSTTLSGQLTGTNNAGRRVVLQSSVWPYTSGFQNASNEQVTNASGGFAFPVLSVPANTQFRVQMPDRPQVVSPIVTVGVKPYVKSKVSKRRVRRGRRVRFTGSIAPATTAGQQQIVVQKYRRGQWVAVAATMARANGSFSIREKIRRGGTYRVWTNATNGQYAANKGKKIKIRTFRR